MYIQKDIEDIRITQLGAMVLYCYHTATYYSANFDRVVDLIKTDLYFKTRHFILFYSL